ncbi:hypothetical protein SCHPADRAFT_883483 [Schizopora paradoxa]|uniref:Zinc finger PHD-type domain-containing protein n=1 Tax=Schizopora paradoxa TaxID=27342 RepID=A0A0H2R355_9AGAM|nr:hypothetical protein SCHPADRAFT_883483 [Schizopora paradoxa]
MAPRTTARSLASSSSTPMPARGPPPVAQPVANSPPQLLELRRHWKWAAVCQFFCTFATLIALDDVTVTDIEEDLLNSTMIVLPRIMQRLLITLTQDRKTNLDNWQTILRRQYNRRDPEANPIGPEPPSLKSRATTVDSEVEMDEVDGKEEATDAPDETPNGADLNAEDDAVQQKSEEKVVEEEGSKEKETKVEEVDTVTTNGTNGVEEEPLPETKDWADLLMLEKLESIHTVMEWHFQNPTRLRGIMRSDDENASWRAEPIGYDAKHNAYWLIGTDRLWLQRPVPTPPKKRKPKKKKPLPVKKPKVKLRLPQTKAKAAVQPEKESGRPSRNAKSARTSQRKATEEPAILSSPQSSGRARAAKTQANVMLDLQAKQLLAVKAEMRSLSRNKGHKDTESTSPAKPTMGTRVSRRLRGPEVEDEEWQQIPEEWLAEAGSSRQHADEAKRKTRQSPRKRRREEGSDDEFVAPKVVVTGTGLESDDESELTELSDAESLAEDAEADDAMAEDAKDEGNQMDEEEEEEKLPEVWPPPDFVEWETICVSLAEWEAIPKNFEGSKHYLEKALFKVLTKSIVPFVTEGLREAAKLRAKEEAMMQRKRSSRLAVRETEKESARLAAQQKAEEDERMARTRRQEARTRREEEERLAREQAREQRRLEREERELQRAKRQEWNSEQSEDMHVDVEDKPATVPDLPKPTPTNGHGNASSSAKPPRKRSSTKKEAKGKSSAEDWELDCELCGAKGRNRDDGLPLMSCGSCNKWQHISCHNADDDQNRRPRRDWDKVDFTCRNCLARKKSGTSNGKRPSSSTNTITLHRVPQGTSSAHTPYAPPNNAYPPSKHLGYPADAGKPIAPNAYQHYPAANNALHPSLGHVQMPFNSNTAMTFAHYQPQQRGFAPQPTTLQPQPQLNHQPYYGQLQPSHQYPHPPAVNNFHPSLQNGASFSNFPGPLQMPPSARSNDRPSHSTGAPPYPTQYRNHYPPIASGSTPYYQAPQ